MRTFIVSVFLFLVVGCSSGTHTQVVQTDPLWVEGELSNGFKYHIYPMEDKPVSIRLLVNIGSLVETEQEQGYAHFVEHMAFNGSKHFTSNDVLKLFEQNGASFGADINAYTGFDETVYQLDLTDSTQLDLALLWMRDISDGLSFSPNEVEKEKGVILGEFRRSRPENQSFVDKSFEDLIRGTVYENRDPLGIRTIVESATSDSLKAFYAKWYQPHLTQLVVTGGVDASVVQSLIEAKFSSWTVKGQKAQLSEAEKIELNYRDFVAEHGVNDPASFSLMIPRGESVVNDHSAIIKEYFDGLSAELIYQRLSGVFNDSTIPLQSLYIDRFNFNSERIYIIDSGFTDTTREPAQNLLLATLASLRDHGVSETELETAMAYYHQRVINLDTEWARRTAADFAYSKVDSLVTGQRKQSKQDYLVSLSRFIEMATLKQANANLAAFLKQDSHILLGVAASESVETQVASLTEIKATYAQKGQKPLVMNVDSSEFESPESLGQRVSYEEKDGFYFWQLENGIEVWYQRDEKAGEQAYAAYMTTGGQSAVPSELHPAMELASAVIIRSGLAGYSGADLDNYLRKRSIALYPFASYRAHGIELTMPVDEIGEAFKVLYNASMHIRVDDLQTEKAKKEFYDNRSQYLESPQGKLGKAINRNTYAPQSTHQLLTGSEVDTVTSEQIRAVHRHLFQEYRNQKMVIVADIDPMEITQALRYFVAPIDLKPASQALLPVVFKSEVQPRIELAANNESNTTYVLRAFNQNVEIPGPKTPFIDDMLQRIIAQRLDKHIREDLGLDYAPSAFPLREDGESITDWYIEAQIESDQLSLLEDAVDQVIADLVKGVTQGEVDSVSKQLIADLLPLSENYSQRGWFYARYLTHGYGLEMIQNVETAVPTITREDIQMRIEQSFGGNSVHAKYILSPEKS